MFKTIWHTPWKSAQKMWKKVVLSFEFNAVVCLQSHCEYKSHHSVHTKCVFYNEEFVYTLRLGTFFSSPIFSFWNELSIIPSYCCLIKWRRWDWNPITSTTAHISLFYFNRPTLEAERSHAFNPSQSVTGVRHHRAGHTRAYYHSTHGS